jgi:hypothetical protein
MIKRSCLSCRYFELREYGVMYCKRVMAIIYSSKACKDYEPRTTIPLNKNLDDFIKSK